MQIALGCRLSAVTVMLPAVFALRPCAAGETIAECAVREVMEETGMTLVNGGSASAWEGFAKSLAVPTPFAAVDSIVYEQPGGQGRLRFHYVVVEVGGVQGHWGTPGAARPASAAVTADSLS